MVKSIKTVNRGIFCSKHFSYTCCRTSETHIHCSATTSEPTLSSGRASGVICWVILFSNSWERIFPAVAKREIPGSYHNPFCFPSWRWEQASFHSWDISWFSQNWCMRVWRHRVSYFLPYFWIFDDTPSMPGFFLSGVALDCIYEFKYFYCIIHASYDMVLPWAFRSLISVYLFLILVLFSPLGHSDYCSQFSLVHSLKVEKLTELFCKPLFSWELSYHQTACAENASVFFCPCISCGPAQNPFTTFTLAACCSSLSSHHWVLMSLVYYFWSFPCPSQ